MKICGRCNNSFACDASANKVCWCVKLPPAQVPKNFKDCLCPDCLKLFVTPEPADFYLDENGNTVFTEAYLLKRGFCCNSNCRHCPY